MMIRTQFLQFGAGKQDSIIIFMLVKDVTSIHQENLAQWPGLVSILNYWVLRHLNLHQLVPVTIFKFSVK